MLETLFVEFIVRVVIIVLTGGAAGS